MNGDFRYTSANMNLPNYYEDFQGLDKASRSIAYAGFANAKREVVVFDYGIVWQATKTVSLSDQVNFSHVHQPGSAEFTSGTTIADSSSAGTCAAPNVTINCTVLTTTPAASGSTPFGGGPAIGTPCFRLLRPEFVTNNATVSWDATARTSLSLTYRYRTHVIARGRSS